ncbi:hypothetical protein ABS767_12620 [Sphingomonas sp. ST-64]|uniref:Uncharacterized protein n=1 Tax=Sphingomonas plantiphila TaxID=3163295 RepID=A0ABW8YPH1_9SPHN
MRYQLTLLFDQQSLEHIRNSGLSVTIVRDADIAAGLAVAWQTFHPLPNNLVEWDDDDEVYGTFSQLNPGAEIIPAATTHAVRGWRYTFGNGWFTATPGGSNPDGYELVNGTDAPVVLGLAKGAVVDGQHRVVPASAFFVPPGLSVRISPQSRVSAFLSTNINSGVVLGRAPMNAFSVELSPERPTARIRYDEATGGFGAA